MRPYGGAPRLAQSRQSNGVGDDVAKRAHFHNYASFGEPDAVTLKLDTQRGQLRGGLVQARDQSHGRPWIDQGSAATIGDSRLRKLGSAELRLLAISADIERDFTPSARRRVFAAIRRLPDRAQQVDLGVVQVALADVDRRIEEPLRLLGTIKGLVDDDDPNEPVLRGTQVALYRVAALARHQGVHAVVVGYPDLSSAQVTAAMEFTKIYPRPGRSSLPRSFKRMLSDLAATGTWDVANDETPPVPQLVP